MEKFKVERFKRGTHQRDGICCGKPPLDEFLRSLVSQYEKRRLGTTYVLVPEGGTRVVGYYTLSSGSVPFDHLPAKAAKKLLKHPVPVVLLARLAIDQSVRGRGLGGALLTHALERVVELSKSLGIHAVEVHALDQEAQTFYLKYGFQPLADDEMHLFLPLVAFDKEYTVPG